MRGRKRAQSAPAAQHLFRQALRVLRDVRHLRVRRLDEIVLPEPDRLVVVPRLDDEHVALEEPAVDHDVVVLSAADRRNRAEVELAVVAREVALGRELHLFLRRSE